MQLMLSSDSGFSVLSKAHRHFRTLTTAIRIVVVPHDSWIPHKKELILKLQNSDKPRRKNVGRGCCNPLVTGRKQNLLVVSWILQCIFYFPFLSHSLLNNFIALISFSFVFTLFESQLISFLAFLPLRLSQRAISPSNIHVPGYLGYVWFKSIRGSSIYF